MGLDERNGTPLGINLEEGAERMLADGRAANKAMKGGQRNAQKLELKQRAEVAAAASKDKKRSMHSAHRKFGVSVCKDVLLLHCFIKQNIEMDDGSVLLNAWGTPLKIMSPNWSAFMQNMERSAGPKMQSLLSEIPMRQFKGGP